MLSQDFSAGFYSTSTTPYNINPLQHLPWSLVGPLIVIAHNRESRHSAGEGEGLRGLHQSWSWLLQLHMGEDTCGQGTSALVSQVQSPPSHRLMPDIWDTHPGGLSPGTGGDSAVSSSTAKLCLPQKPHPPVRRELWDPTAQGRIYPGAGREICMWGSLSCKVGRA